MSHKDICKEFSQKLKNLALKLKNRMISVHLQGKPFNIMVNQAYAPTSKAGEADVERFYEDLQFSSVQ